MTSREFLIAALGIGGLLILWAVYRAGRSAMNSLYLADLVTDETGKWSRAAMMAWAAFAMTTWMIVFLTIQGKITEGYFTVYGALWITPLVTRILKA